MAEANTTTNSEISIVEDSLNLSDNLPPYNRNADRSRSFLDGKENAQSRFYSDRQLNTLVEFRNKEFSEENLGGNLVSTPKRNLTTFTSLLDVSPILRSNSTNSLQQVTKHLIMDKSSESDIVIGDVESAQFSKCLHSENETHYKEGSSLEIVDIEEESSLLDSSGPNSVNGKHAYIDSSSESSVTEDRFSNERRFFKEHKQNIICDAPSLENSDSDSPYRKNAGRLKGYTSVRPLSDTDRVVEKKFPDEDRPYSEELDASVIVLDSSKDSQGNRESNSKGSHSKRSDEDGQGVQKSERIRSKFKTLDEYVVRGALRKGPEIISPPSLNPNEYNRLICSKPSERLFGGKMTLERINAARAITGDIISKMHASIAGAPSEKQNMKTPDGLITELLPHQKRGLSWMLWREEQTPPGGILADDMGLGKTLSFIALIVEQMNRRKQDSEERLAKKQAICANFLVPSTCTLVIVPASLIYQWEAELKKHVKCGWLNVYIYHGPKQKRESDARRLARYNVVLTTYNTVSNELSEKKLINDSATSSDDESLDIGHTVKPKCKIKRTCDGKDSVLTKIAWERIVLDEAHQIKNKASLISKACCRLPGISRWCSSGTPIHNKLWDLFSLIRFLRVRPFDEEAVWKEYIMGSSGVSSDRLNTLVNGLLLRREKTDINPVTNRPIVELKEKKHEDICLELRGLEKKVYEFMFLASRQKVRELIEQNTIGSSLRRSKWNEGAKLRNPFLGGIREIRVNDNFQAMSSVLTLLLRLRQACVHMALTKKAIDLEAFEDVDFGCGEDVQLSSLTKSLANLSVIEQEAIEANVIPDRKDLEVSALFEPSFNSTKMRALLGRLDRILEETNDKCVVVSQWTSLLEIIEQRLIARNINYTSITGKVLPKNRQPCVDSFNRKDGGPRVLLLSLTAGGIGLNLVGGNHLFLLDLHWNPAIEQQACDRIYRMGQEKNVFIHKFICNETIEQRVLNLQDSKRAMAKSVLEGATSKKLSKLTVNDIKFLFDLNSGGYRRIPVDAQPTSFQTATNLAKIQQDHLSNDSGNV